MTEKLNQHDEVLFRQIHPQSFQNGEPTSAAFVPNSNDNNKLSVDRKTLTTAQQSHALYTSNGLKSAAVFGLSVGEFGEYEIDCLSDPLEATSTQAENKAHALADYSKHTNSKQKNIGKRLKQKAIDRGCLYTL